MILTVSGSDRPGLTRALAAAVLAGGGNWLESHLSRLGGMYVGAVLVEVANGEAARLEAAVREIGAAGLTVSAVAAGEEPAAQGQALTIELVGQDRPGIVSEVTAVLAGLGVNIEELDTGLSRGAWSGERLFRAKLQVMAPPGVGPDAVRTALEAISGDLMVDFSFGEGE
jgi:glycine cleavage system regulatory protein